MATIILQKIEQNRLVQQDKFLNYSQFYLTDLDEKGKLDLRLIVSGQCGYKPAIDGSEGLIHG